MNTYTEVDLAGFPRNEYGIKLCQPGDYSSIKDFESSLSFGPGCVFGSFSVFGKCNFGSGCTFIEHTIFGHECKFDLNCSFEFGRLFGSNCNFFKSKFDSNCHFGGCCKFRDCDFQQSSSFGPTVTVNGACRICGLKLTESLVGPILSIGPIGSREDVTTFYRTEGGIFVTTGCFSGFFDYFLSQVEGVHEDSKHAKVYRAAVELARTQFDMEVET